MNFEIQDEVLDLIEDNIHLLDDGLRNFLDEIVPQVIFSPINHTYTLMAFLNNMCDGDWRILFNRLKSEGIYTWSYFADIQKNCSSYSVARAVDPYCSIINFMYSNMVLENKNEFGNFYSCNYNPDFLYHLDLEVEEELANKIKLNIPLVHCGISKELLDGYDGDLYTAVIVSKEKFPNINNWCTYKSKHSCIQYSWGKLDFSVCVIDPSWDYGFIWVPLKCLSKGRITREGLSITLLPRNIIEKYNLPILDNVSLEEIEI